MNKIGLLAIAGIATTGITATALTRRGSSSAEGDGGASKSTFIPNSNFAKAYRNKYGGSYGKYLAGPETSTGWWNNKYQEIKDSISQSKGFEGVTKGYGNDDGSLNKVCEKAYNYSDPQEEEDGQQPTPAFDKVAIWKFCSDNETRPKSIAEYNFEPKEKTDDDKEEYKAATVESTVGESQSSQLASIKHLGNKWFWDLKGEEFFKDKEIISGTGFFGSYYKANQSTNDKAKVIKDACEKAYKQVEGYQYDGQASNEEIFKWCSFIGELQSAND